MNITVMSPVGEKINRMPYNMQPEVSIFLSSNNILQDLPMKEKLEQLTNFIKNFSIEDFYKDLELNLPSFINKMMKHEGAYISNQNSLELFIDVIGKVSNNHEEDIANLLKHDLMKDLKEKPKNKEQKQRLSMQYAPRPTFNNDKKNKLRH